jgi:hypothetical protein
MTARSPHYSPKRNPPSVDSPRDGRLEAALDALRIVADADPDHARHANGMGFAKSDVTGGHRLATALRNTASAAEAIRLDAVEGYWKRPKLTRESRKRRKGVHSVRVRQGSHLTPLLSVAKLAHYKPIFKYDLQVLKAMAAMGGPDKFRAEFDRAMNKL